jgi:phosphoribosylcarboxyaminoimidazole (NCAIR) mutase
MRGASDSVDMAAGQRVVVGGVSMPMTVPVTPVSAPVSPVAELNAMVQHWLELKQKEANLTAELEVVQTELKSEEMQEVKKHLLSTLET